jgi:hypothetical protein
MSAFTFDVNQRITSTTGAITHVVDGLPFGAAGALVVTNGTLAPAQVQNGWPLESDGKVAIHVGGTTTQWQNGLPLTAVGRLCSDNTTAVSLFQNGLPLTASRISIA